MLKHPSSSLSSSKCKTFDSSKDVDATMDSLWKYHPYVGYIRKFNELLGLSNNKLLEMSTSLKPVELHLQSLTELLYNQKCHYRDPLKYKRSKPTSITYMKSLGSDLAVELEQLIEKSNTSFRDGEVPLHWYSILPAKYIEENHKLDTNYKELVDKSFKLLTTHWRKSGYIDDNYTASSKANTITKWTIGKDIGIKGVPYLLLSKYNTLELFKRGDQPFTYINENTVQPSRILSTNTLERIKMSLDTYGVAIIRRVFTKEQINFIRDMLLINTSMSRDTAFKMLEYDPNVTALKYARGRINCLLRGTRFNDLLSPLQAFWLPIVYYNMNDRRLDCSMCKLIVDRIFVSGVQLISSDSMSYNEPWHRDNKNFGLNVIIPLDNIDANNGRLQFIPGTHRVPYADGKIKTAVNIIIGPVGTDMNVGDVLIYNSSILHRNTFNDSIKCQSMLSFTYDYVDTPPPGQGLIRCIVDRIYGSIIVQVNYLFS